MFGGNINISSGEGRSRTRTAHGRMVCLRMRCGNKTNGVHQANTSLFLSDFGTLASGIHRPPTTQEHLVHHDPPPPVDHSMTPHV